MARFTRIILIILITNLFGYANAKSPPPGTGTSDIPANILIMLDNSGSMSARLGGSTSIHYPVDVNVDSNGNIYVLEYWNNRIKKFDSSGNFLKSFGGSGSSCNRWRSARQFDIDGNFIYISDTNNARIVKLTLDGGCVRTRSTGFLRESPQAMAVENGGGYAWVGGGGRSGRIASYFSSNLNQNSGGNVYSNQGGGYNFIWGASWAKNGRARLGYANASKNNVRVAYRSGHQLIGDNNPYSNNYVRRCNANAPTDVAFDSAGNVYYTSRNRHAVYKLNMSTCGETKVVGSWSSSAGFRYPYGIEIDSSDNIYVTDYYNFSVRKYNTSGSETLSVGSGGTRIAAAIKVIKKIVSNTDLTSGANFGLMEWSTTRSSDTRIRVKISDTGAKTIFSDVGSVRATGYTTDLNHAMNVARNYFLSGQVSNWNKSCSQNYLIVISDGYWTRHSSVLAIADSLNKANNIKTFAVGFALGSANNNYKTLAQKGGTTSPLYADNETELLAKLTDAIKQAISGRLTFTTPAVMSDVTKGDFIYQATFEYEKSKQWKGRLKKYKLNSNGTFGAEQWDAADKLFNKKASSRNIWTVGPSHSTNNFTLANRDDLKALMFPSQSPTDDQVDNLINFIRGVDTYDQDADNNKTESIHKLADIYHSEVIVVGIPEASTQDTGAGNFTKTDAYYRSQKQYNNFKSSSECGGNCNSRTELIYAGANNGILHAFKTSDGEELWGYIPPFLLGNFERIPSSKANSTNAIYGIDGSPVAKDIYFDDTPNDSVNNPRWRTVLLGGVGAGGNGLYMLDITDPTNPKQLFAIHNDATNKEITHWNTAGFQNIYSYGATNPPADLDYRKLGETWSTPRILRIKVNGADKWVAVLGGGYNGGVSPDIGSAVFVVDLENEGKLLKKINITDQANVMHNYVWGLPKGTNTLTEFDLETRASITSYNVNCCKLRVSGAGDIPYTITGTLVGDEMRNLKLKFDSPPPGGTNFTVQKVNKTDIINSLPANLSVITSDSTSKANYDGAIVYAADLEGKITKINLTDNFNLNSDNMISNISSTTLFNSQSTSDNGRYIYTRPEITINNDNNLWLYFGTGNTQKLQDQSNKTQNRVYGIKDKDFPSYVDINPPGDVSKCKTSPTCPGTSDLGWYVNLPNAQKLTAEPTVDKDRVYFPIYEPTSGTNACKTGKAILTAYDSKCGNSVLNVNLGTGVLSKVVKQGDNLYIGIAGEANKNISGFTSKDNLITGKSQAKDTGTEIQLEKWIENY